MVLITNSTVDSILELTRLTGIFSIATDREQALELLADTKTISKA
jgi:hypothetical protein